MIDLRINFLRESSETMPRPVERVSGPFIDVTMSMAQLSAGPMAQSGRAQCSSVTVADYRCDTATGAAGCASFRPMRTEDRPVAGGWSLPACWRTLLVFVATRRRGADWTLETTPPDPMLLSALHSHHHQLHQTGRLSDTFVARGCHVPGQPRRLRLLQ
jgi:hypothetical protein